MQNFDRHKHWEAIYSSKQPRQASWYEPVPATSLSFIKQFNIPFTAKIIDVGGGDSFFADHLLDLGYRNITVLDISGTALDRAKERLGARAAFHFLTDEKEIETYLSMAYKSIYADGILVVGAFSEQGPEKCSGIEVRQYSKISMTENSKITLKRSGAFQQNTELLPALFRTLSFAASEGPWQVSMTGMKETGAIGVLFSKAGLKNNIIFQIIAMKPFCLLVTLLSAGNALTQEATGLKQHQQPDTVTLVQAFSKGKATGHFRYFLMATDNAEGLSDYYAHAAGGRIKYETAPFRNFQMGFSSSLVYNLGSSDLTKPDAATRQLPRYETSLFDVKDPANKNDMGRLEEFYVKYYFSHTRIVFGKQLISTPFINMQDGRMRPTAVDGLWVETNEVKNTRIQGGYLIKISPRGTNEWFHTGTSIGLYVTGRHVDGTRARYAGNLKSKGIGWAGISHQATEHVKLQLWEQYVEHIFNTVLFQADFECPSNSLTRLIAAIQFIRQDAIKDGGNEDPALSYFVKKGKAFTYGSKLGWKNEHMEATISYNRITAKGRFLQPREWGTEPFFTFMPRERNEGHGNVHAATIKLRYQAKEPGWRSSLQLGYFRLPDVKNYRLNKYGMPSYAQVNADAGYSFKKSLNGLEVKALYVYKYGTGETHGSYSYVFNRTDMASFNLILDYRF